MKTGQSRRAGFTLLEMMLAVAILVIISATVQQFTQVSLRAADASSKAGDEAMEYGGFRRLLRAQFSALPAGEHGALIGMNIKNKGGSGRRDAMQMVCPAGNALLTPDARGLYQVTLDLRELPRGSGHYALGLEREPWTDDDDDDDDDAAPVNRPAAKTAGKNTAPSDWVQLIDNVQSLEIAYFDARLNGWVDKWTDSSMLPNLVRIRLTPVGGEVPYEIVERVPGGGLAKSALPASVQTLLNNGGVRAPGTVVNPGANNGVANPGVQTVIPNQPNPLLQRSRAR